MSASPRSAAPPGCPTSSYVLVKSADMPHTVGVSPDAGAREGNRVVMKIILLNVALPSTQRYEGQEDPYGRSKKASAARDFALRRRRPGRPSEPWRVRVGRVLSEGSVTADATFECVMQHPGRSSRAVAGPRAHRTTAALPEFVADGREHFARHAKSLLQRVPDGRRAAMRSVP
jgi:hypothetical protein